MSLLSSELRAGLRDFLSASGPPAGAPGQWWKALTELGLFSIPVPAERGGLGLSLAESAPAFEELGRALSWGPLVWTQLAVLAVPESVSGHQIVAGVDLAAQPDGDPVLVEHLAVADRMLVLSDDGVLLYETGDLDYTELSRPLDPETPVARLDGLPKGLDSLPKGAVVAASAERLRRIGTLLSAAFLLGISDTALRIATDYAKERRQFGRPIGGFQAIKHLLADCCVRTSLARAALYAAAELEAAGTQSHDLSVAKLLCGRAADGNARTAVQVFGGMGFTWETTPHLLLKRAWVLDSAFGTGDQHALLLGNGMAVA